MTLQRTAASFGRRLGALLYDAIAAFAVVYLAAFIPVLAAGAGALAPGNAVLFAYIIVVDFLYFGICWTRGRTLGMQAWKLEIERVDGARPGWGEASRRFLFAAAALACGGLGYLLALRDPERRAWPDRYSGTRLIYVRTNERGKSEKS